MDFVYLIPAAIVVWLNLIASHRLQRSAAYTKEQKKYQLLAIWFLPVIGALLVLGVIWSDATVSKSRTAGARSRSSIGGVFVSAFLLDFPSGSKSSVEDNAPDIHSDGGGGDI